MKALEILEKLKEGSFTPYTNDSLVKIDEAIRELEDLHNENKTSATLLEEMIEERIELRKENLYLKSRSCVT